MKIKILKKVLLSLALINFTFLNNFVNAGPADEGNLSDPDTSSTPITIIETYDAPMTYPEGMTYDGEYIWSTSIHSDLIYKHDPDTGGVVGTIPAPGSGPMDLAWDGKYLWNADYGANKIFKLDTDGNILKEFNSPGEQPMGLAWDGKYLWHTDYTLQKIYKMNTDGNIIASFDSPGKKPHGLAWDGKYLWNADAVTYNIYKLDTDGNVLEKYYFPYSYPTGLALQGGFLWMAARDTGKIYKMKVKSTASSWPKFMGNLKNTGLSAVDTSHINGTIKWKYKIESDLGFLIESSPSIGPKGAIYFGSHENKVYAINSDGTLKWKFNAGDPVYEPSYGVWKGILSSPAISADGTIYISSLNNYLFALNPNGTEKWRFSMKITPDTWSSPVIGKDGTIYIGSARSGDGSGGKIYAINPNGSEKWSFRTESDVFPSMAIDDKGTIYSGNGSTGKFYAINPNGSLKWMFQTKKHIESSAAIGEDGTIYFGSWDNKIYALSPEGKKKWEYLTEGNGLVTTPAIGKDGTIYFMANDKNLYSFNPEGIIKWKISIGDGAETTSSPSIGDDGTIYLGTPAGNFYAINPDGTVKWRFKLGGTSASPSIGKDGTVYITSHDGLLYAFGGPLSGSSSISEGALIRATGDIDVYIVKYAGSKKFKRLILSPQVFNSYGHLRWENIMDVDQSVVNGLTTSDMVRATVEEDPRVYRIFPKGDTGTKRWIKTAEAFNRFSYDWDAIYAINKTERDAYFEGEIIE